MRHHLSSSRYRTWLFLVLILLLASGLRFYRIGAQSFWNDEGNSARLAERSVSLILKGAKGDIHPPGYYLVLHYWRALLGQSEAALRGLSVVCSVALAGFTFLLGRRLFADEAVGLAAAALVAANPFQVYYAQEARMYAMLALWALASTWALAEWLPVGDREPEARRWPLVIYVLTAAAGLYTHYAFPFVLLAQSLGVGVWGWRGQERGDAGRRLLTWVVAVVAIVVLYLPWLPTAWHQVTSWSTGRESYQLLDALADMWRLLGFGLTVPTEMVIGGLVATGSLVLLSLLPPVGEDDGPDNVFPYGLRWGLAALMVLVPVGLILGLGLYKAAYLKFLLVVAAPLSLLVARGAVGGWRIAGGIGVWGEQSTAIGYRAVMLFLAALVLFDTGRSLHNLYFKESYARSDYRAIARHIEANTRPGDAILLNAPNQWEVFTYYYPDDGHVFPLARQRPFNATANQAELESIVADHERLFAVFWGDAESDPGRFIESWLETHTYKAGETWYGAVRLAVYAVPARGSGEASAELSRAVADVPDVPLDVRFVPGGRSAGPAIHLDGYTLLTDALAPGDIAQLALFWRATEPIPDRYKVFVHLYDGAGRLVAQTDSEPGATLRPTDTWSPGERITDRYGVLIPPEVSPGTYTLAVGLYAIADPDDRLPVTRDGALIGDRLDLTSITIVP
jgi:mannosyltransferase